MGNVDYSDGDRWWPADLLCIHRSPVHASFRMAFRGSRCQARSES